jgi:hypothetical protein
MIRKTVTIAITLLLVVSFIGTAMALEEGNKRKGKYTYRKVYKACFDRGEVSEAKPPLSPDTKTMAQWKRVFEAGDLGEFGCQEEWSVLSQEEINDIYSYLYNHAADSPTPAKCK